MSTNKGPASNNLDRTERDRLASLIEAELRTLRDDVRMTGMTPWIIGAALAAILWAAANRVPTTPTNWGIAVTAIVFLLASFDAMQRLVALVDSPIMRSPSSVMVRAVHEVIPRIVLVASAPKIILGFVFSIMVWGYLASPLIIGIIVSYGWRSLILPATFLASLANVPVGQPKPSKWPFIFGFMDFLFLTVGLVGIGIAAATILFPWDMDAFQFGALCGAALILVVFLAHQRHHHPLHHRLLLLRRDLMFGEEPLQSIKRRLRITLMGMRVSEALQPHVDLTLEKLKELNGVSYLLESQSKELLEFVRRLNKVPNRLEYIDKIREKIVEVKNIANQQDEARAAVAKASRKLAFRFGSVGAMRPPRDPAVGRLLDEIDQEIKVAQRLANEVVSIFEEIDERLKAEP